MDRTIYGGTVFSVDMDTDRVVAAIQSGGVIRHYECKLHSCDNPVCTCNNVELKFFPRDDSVQNNPISSYQVDMDVVERKLAYKDENKVFKENLVFAKLLLASLDEADFQFLLESHYLYKNELTEKADIETIEAVFDYQDIEENGLLYAYHDVLPYGDPLSVSLDGKVRLIYDQYCLKPKCSCTDTVMSFFSSTQSNEPLQELFAIDLDYKKKQWAAVERKAETVDVGAVRSAVEDQIPDFYSLIYKRHIKMKQIYAHCKKRYFKKEKPIGLGQGPAVPKVGRNDPCPCGSGKKYKKCCM